MITVADSSLDFETTPSYRLTVRVVDDGTPSLFDAATFTINLVDVIEGDGPLFDLADPVNNGSIGQTELNTRGYIVVTFLDDGTVLPSIDGDEFTISGTGSGTAVLDVTPPTPLGGDAYRYTFTGSFATGVVNVDFQAGSVTNGNGISNQAETESFTVVESEPPIADLADPTNGATITDSELNTRGYIDVTFTDSGSGIDPATIDGDEPSLSGSGVGTALLDGTAALVSGTTYRYAFTGTFVSDTVDVTSVAGSFQDLIGNSNAAEIIPFQESQIPS